MTYFTPGQIEEQPEPGPRHIRNKQEPTPLPQNKHAGLIKLFLARKMSVMVTEERGSRHKRAYFHQALSLCFTESGATLRRWLERSRLPNKKRHFPAHKAVPK